MADDKKEEQQEKEQAKQDDKQHSQYQDERPGKSDDAEKTKEKGKLAGIMPWVIMAVIIIACAGSGFFLAKLFASSPEESNEESALTEQPEQTQKTKTVKDTKADPDAKPWYYAELEPTVASLDEPEVTRYVRATIILEMSPELDSIEGAKLIDEKKPALTNWLTIYLASLTLDDVTGNTNLRHIQAQILDGFNEILFPDAKPQIKYILYKEFIIN